MDENKRPWWLGPAASAFAAATLVARLHHAPTKREAVFGRFTEAEVEARSEGICRALWPGVGTVSLAAEHLCTGAPGRPIRRHWEVDCMDPTGRELTFFDWDAETGDLIGASRPSQPPIWRESSALRCWDAARSQAIYLRRLGLASSGRSWRLMSVPRRDGCAWRATWKCQDLSAILSVDAYNGSLLLAATVPRSYAAAAGHAGR